MGLDIRWPIGVLFLVLGLLLAGYGFASDVDIYRRSLGVNVNLWWGAVMAVFGALMLLLARRGRRRMTSGATRSRRPQGEAANPER